MILRNKKVLIIISSMLIICSYLNTNLVSAAIVEPQVTSKSALVVDLKTGQVIADKNGSERLPIASVSKLIVVYMVEQAIKNDDIKSTDKVEIPQNIVDFSNDDSVANVALSANQNYSVADLEKAALLPSSNSAAMALANLVAGSQQNYYIKAEKLLSNWGIKNTHIYSSSGLKDGDLGPFNDANTNDNCENVLSAREVAVVARKLVTDYPNVLEITKEVSADFPKANGDGSTQKIENTNTLLNNHSGYNFSGLKTGVTGENGDNFVGITQINAEPVITIVLNSGTNDPDKLRFSDTISLLNQVKESTVIKPADNSKEYFIANADVKDGIVKARLANKMKFFIKNKDNDNLNVRVNLDKNSAPFKKSQTVMSGKIQFSNRLSNDFLLGKKPLLKYAATKKIKKANFFITTYRNLISLFK